MCLKTEYKQLRVNGQILGVTETTNFGLDCLDTVYLQFQEFGTDKYHFYIIIQKLFYVTYRTISNN